MDIKIHSVCLFDIEGTLIPVNFVNEVLTPYILQKVPSFVDKFGLEKDVANFLIQENETDFKKGLYAEKISRNKQIIKPPTISYIQHIIKIDKNCMALAMIKEKILRHGCEAKEINWKVFTDVPKFLQYLKKYYIRVGIYSIDDVDSQISLFKYTSLGDMTPYISHYFDLKIGAKTDSSSYTNIARAIKTTPKKIAFFTDSLEEAETAKKAGLHTIVVKRPGSKGHGMHLHESIMDFMPLMVD
ncbi:MAG: acireductone synthase [Leptospiraceae bacterium]|nr:acireductone synthase [Leptospiraceae bacterium]MCP5495329.1 acireductone synthase [Leptospiraceae bacterium]